MKVDVKICGLTKVEDARVALAAGADYLGFILYSGSPRAVTPDRLSSILEALGEGRHRAVGVFVNAAPSFVCDMALQCGLSAVQIHGDEDAVDFQKMPVPVWRAVAFDGGKCRPSPEAWPAARYVVDAAVPGQYGGTGVTADWDFAEALVKRVPVMLAGGLTPTNVEEAVRRVQPLGVDVSSGVELRPGVKSHDAVRLFIAAVRRQAERLRALA